MDDGNCVDTCPSGKIADNLRAKCLDEEMAYKIDVMYTMAYSHGSCNNMCGQTVKDCSCDPNLQILKEIVVLTMILLIVIQIIDNSSQINAEDCKALNCQYCDDVSSPSPRQAARAKIVQKREVAARKNNDKKPVKLAVKPDLRKKTNVVNSKGGNKNKTATECKSCDNQTESGQNGNMNQNNNTVKPPSTNSSAALKCTQCQDGYLLVNGKCLQTCPGGYLLNPDNRVCIKVDKSKILLN